MSITKGEIRGFLKANRLKALSNLNSEYEPLVEDARKEIIKKFESDISNIKTLASHLHFEIDNLYKKMHKDENIGCEKYSQPGLYDAEKLDSKDWEYAVISTMTVNNKYKQLKYELCQKQDEIQAEYSKLERMITRTNSTKQILTSLEALGFDTTKIEATKRQNALLVINADKDKLFYPNKQN